MLGIAEGGVVLWVILALGVVELGVFFERLLHMRRASINYADFLKGIRTILARGNISEAAAICEDTPGPVAALVRVALEHRHESRRLMREAVDSTGRAELVRLERRISVVATITYTAPLLGLLGTVLGIAESAVAIRAQVPLVDVVHVTNGLLKALTTTAAGLLVAAPGYAMYNLLITRIDRIALDMESAATEIVTFLTSVNDEKGGAAAEGDSDGR
ncbi:MAG: MotA/TolQ/ExbB proton channel family protein [Lentisphaerae bacterium]|jgi:biopolymer transport protein ExbB|nr:MotA/TolQ/ExbB proton channel family protein [Lentisphaerota bacterium]